MTDGLRIIHDPGHGGPDNRGVVHGGIVEAEYTLQIALQCFNALASWCSEQYCTRMSDSELALANRGHMARDKGAGLSLVHHVNAIYHRPKIVGYRTTVGENGASVQEAIYGRREANTDIDGLMVFYLPGCWRSREVAAAIMRAAPEGLQRRKQRGTPALVGDWTRLAYNVLRHHMGRPAVLIEWGFATAPRDVEILTSLQSQRALITAAQAGVARFIELQ